MKNIRILFQSSGLIAVDKPAGILSIPGSPGSDASQLEMLETQFGAKFYPVHRLDRDVSGVILYAKNPEAHREMNRQFSSRLVSKGYLALVHGQVKKDEGEIDQPIRQYGSGRMGVDPVGGKPSQTNYRVAQRGLAYTLLHLRPTTGRRHQIRVHLYSLGTPLVGDRRYGEPTLQKKFPRLMLHAASIRVYDPSGPDEITITAPIPVSFQRVCDSLI